MEGNSEEIGISVQIYIFFFLSRGSNYMRPIELRDIILNQIRSNGDMFLQKFIPQLVRIFQNANALKSVNKSKQELIMECASHMIVSDVRRKLIILNQN